MNSRVPPSAPAYDPPTIRSRVLSITVLVLLLAIAVWQRERLMAAFESAILTPAVSIFSADDAGSLWRVEIIRYWVAAFAWTTAFVVIARRVARSWTRSAPVITAQQTTPRFRRGNATLLSFVFLALAGPLFTTADPFAQGPLESNRLLPPMTYGRVNVSPPPTATGTAASDRLRQTNWFLQSGLSTRPGGGDLRTREVLFILGSDAVGRDVLSRLVYGTHVSLGIGLAAAFGALLLGSLIGFFSGYSGRTVDRVLMWGSDVFLSIPTLFLIIALVFFVGGSVAGIIVVLIFSGWMRIARLVRGEVLHLRDREFIQTARLLGQSPGRIIRRHLLPNVLPVLLSAAVLQVSDSMLAEASLGFLGFGVQPPVPSWGNMLGDSISHLEHAWWLAAAPGLFLTILMTALHATSEELQEMLRV